MGVGTKSKWFWRGLPMLLACGSDALAREWVVHPDGSGDAGSIQQAVDVASSGDIILLGNGRFGGQGNQDVVVAGKAVAIRSLSGDATRCIIDCGGESRALFFRWADGRSEVSGVTVERGGGADLGGAIVFWGSGGSVRDCQFRLCLAQGGGAVFVQDCSIDVASTVFAHNGATHYGGGAVSVVRGEVAVRGCTFYGNGAEGPAQGSSIALDSGAYASVENTIMASGVFREPVWADSSSSVRVACTDAYGNDVGDWVGTLSGLGGQDGNISADPLLCDPAGGVFTLKTGSPCGPDGPCGLIGALPVECDEADPIPVLQVTTLGPPLPNPTSDGVTLSLDVAVGAVGSYQLRVYDVAGRHILARVIQVPTPTSYAVAWDGRDGRGQATPAGVYFLRLEGPGLGETRRVVRLH